MLERRVAGRLFERGRFGVRPTELGRTVYPAAKRALEALESVSADHLWLAGVRLTIEVEERAGALVGLPVRGLDLQRELRAIRRRRPAPSATARAFWRWLDSHTG